MRHRVYGKHLGRNKNQRTALFRSLIQSLILEGSITTTESKAKAIKGLVDRLISKGKKGGNSRQKFIESILPHPAVSQKLREKVVPRYPSRTSGFTSLVRLGRRVGDGAMMVRISLMEEDKVGEDKKESGKDKKEVTVKRREKAVKKAAKSAKGKKV